MPQPDSGDNCCDCPSRTGPCDDCGTDGACCIHGVCSILSEDDCVTSSGFYFGNGTDCEPNPCDGLGCCSGPSSCVTTPETDCAFTWEGPGVFCCVGSGGACSNCIEALNESCCISLDGTFGYCCDLSVNECCDDTCCPIGFCIAGICLA